MSKGKQAEIELTSIRKPLEPVGERVTKKQKSEYARLLGEYERIDEIRDSQVKGASLSFDKETKHTSTPRPASTSIALTMMLLKEVNEQIEEKIEYKSTLRDIIIDGETNLSNEAWGDHAIEAYEKLGNYVNNVMDVLDKAQKELEK